MSSTDKNSNSTAPTRPARPSIEPGRIKPGMPIVCSNDKQFATVDHAEGWSRIKVAKDDNGVHHYFPMSWVIRIDDKVHLDRPGEQAMREWRTESP